MNKFWHKKLVKASHQSSISCRKFPIENYLASEKENIFPSNLQDSFLRQTSISSDLSDLSLESCHSYSSLPNKNHLLNDTEQKPPKIDIISDIFDEEANFSGIKNSDINCESSDDDVITVVMVELDVGRMYEDMQKTKEQIAGPYLYTPHPKRKFGTTLRQNVSFEEEFFANISKKIPYKQKLYESQKGLEFPSVEYAELDFSSNNKDRASLNKSYETFHKKQDAGIFNKENSLKNHTVYSEVDFVRTEALRKTIWQRNNAK